MPDPLILPNGLPEEIKAKFQKNGQDVDKCVQTFFRIKDKSGNIVTFRYNRPQKLHAQRSSDFDMVLKGRKMGVSSRRIARDLWVCATRKNQHRVLLTHSGDASQVMMSERVMPAIQNCRFPLNATTRKDYIYFPLTNSRYYVGTAGAKKFGRGDDITGYHFSEYAHWSSPDVVDGIEQGLVEKSDGLIETTANGHNFFKKDWETAKKSKSRYRAIFLPWFAAEDYVRDPQLEAGPIGEEEQAIMDAFGLTPENIAWRRWKKRTMRDPNLFPQEYPETDKEAFLSTGRPVFDKITLARIHNMVSEPKFRGYLTEQMGRINLNLNPDGELRIWKIPERGHIYAIGADVAEGIKGGAYSVGEVIDVGDSEQVAEWHGHCSPDIFADHLFLLSRYYNQGIIIPESWPGPGEVTTSHLAELGAKVWQSTDEDRPGFKTDRHSKTKMILAFNAALRDFSFTIRSMDLLEELHAFIYDDGMSMVPSLGNFSDRVMAMGIGYYCSRDLADRVDYYRPAKPEFIKQIGVGSFTTVPRWQGVMPGRRRE